MLYVRILLCAVIILTLTSIVSYKILMDRPLRGVSSTKMQLRGVPSTKLQFDLVVLVLSARENRAVRDAIRRTWAHGHPNVYFVVGRECPYSKEDREPWTCTPKPNAVRQHMDDVESSSDMIVVDVVDVYRNLALKLRAAYDWVLENTKAKYTLKIDDDCLVRVDALNKWLHNRTARPYEIIAAGYARNAYVFRSGKWKEQLFQGRVYPPFPSGAGHMISRPVLEYLYAHPYTWVSYQGEDTSVGIWIDAVRKNISIRMVSTRHFTVSNTNCYDKEKLVVGHDLSIEKMESCWRS